MGSLVQLITRCRIKFSSEYCSKTLEDLLRSLIKVDPDTRLGAPPHGAGQVKQHSFFKAMDWDALMRKEILAPCALDDVYARTDGQMPTREKSAVKLNEEFGTFTGFDEGGDDAELQVRKRRIAHIDEKIGVRTMRAYIRVALATSVVAFPPPARHDGISRVHRWAWGARPLAPHHLRPSLASVEKGRGPQPLSTTCL